MASPSFVARKDMFSPFFINDDITIFVFSFFTFDSDGRVIRFIMKDRTMHRGLHRAGRGALDPQVP